MSGGKGGSTTSEQKIPEWLEGPAKANLEKARLAGEIGYMPYYGPEVAALSPMQQSAMQNTMGAMSAFGMAPAGAQYKSSLPEPTTMGGVTGYSSGNLYDQALAELGRRNPDQMERYNRAMASTSDATSAANQGSTQTDPRLNPASPMYDPAYYNRVMASGIDGGGGGGPQVSGNYWAQREAEVGPTRARLEQEAQNQKISNFTPGILGMIARGSSGGGFDGGYSGPSNTNSNADKSSSSVYGSGGFL